MVKLVYCLRRRSDMTLEEFQRYWLDVHGPLVRSHGDVLRIRRYVQVHTAATPESELLRASRGTPGPFDGVAELWWDSVEDLIDASATPEGRKAASELLEDEKRFIDLEQSPIWLAREHELIGLETGGG